MINFFTVATGRYKIFILPYIISSLYHNNNSTIELLVDDINFISKNVKGFLNDAFKDRWIVKPIPNIFSTWLSKTKKVKSIRWLYFPNQYADYTYIGDIDILMLDRNIVDMHKKHAEYINKPYSNIVRNHPTKKKMTGLHFVHTSPYYGKLNKNIISKYVSNITTDKISNRYLDECLLYSIVKRFFGFPTIQSSGEKPWEKVVFRPVHGIHVSFGRRLIGWGITSTLLDSFNVFCKTDVWKIGSGFFDPMYVKALNTFQKSYILHRERNDLRQKVWHGGLTEKGKALCRKRIVQIENIKFKI